MKINWKVRFSKHNLTFIIRFIGALLIPALGYLGIKYEDINSWEKLLDVLIGFISNPYLIGLTIVNAINLIPDPTTRGLSDSKRALTYEKPGE
ncbi:phage holin [Ureibacillus thermophilus]|uniref:Phage holin n=1 Tax=Ureibacillus thermophilus TaxID=367743 RepID=A0A4V1A3C4_9BACL|nr:phage holin [Ureibacillus thermophilus]QBK26760.1 phage holin [Ureibacillus thermophilus]